MTTAPPASSWPAVLDGFDLTDHAAFARSPDGIPYDVFARLRREAPVLWHPPGRTGDGEGFWVLTRHADIAAVARDPATFSARGGGDRPAGGSHLEDLPFGMLAGVIMAMMDNPRHHLLGDLLGPAVTDAAAAALQDELRAAAVALVDRAAAAGRCDLATDVCEPFAYLAIAILLGVPDEDRPRVAGWAHESTGFHRRRTGVADDVSRVTFAATREYVADLLARKRADPGPDLATILATGEIAAHRDEPPLTDAEREQNLLLLLLTGGEQPRNTLASGLRALARQPGGWRALRGDRDAVPTAIEEMLRWAPPNPYNRRTATRDVRIGDAAVTAGDKVTLWWPSANRDEDVFPDPGAFDLRRDPNPHMTFGHGNHYCLGDRVARRQFGVLLDVLLERVEDLRPAGPVTYQPSNKHTIVLDMPVELRPARS
ncbi:cytochrome P450 [Actinomadura flavalba]|uniref:cytochrome P450 n=1 Tax=Actinomadura flavalba TaxID=1120938 RepID=UPI00037B8B0E|nr:cytochrome P450 [Actinomadura flavalba]